MAGGFPCQDLSQAGRKKGIRGGQSSLVSELFRLAEGEIGERLRLDTPAETPDLRFDPRPHALVPGRSRQARAGLDLERDASLGARAVHREPRRGLARHAARGQAGGQRQPAPAAGAAAKASHLRR